MCCELVMSYLWQRGNGDSCMVLSEACLEMYAEVLMPCRM